MGTRHVIGLALAVTSLVGKAQLVVWAEEFENGCSSGCYATAYTTGPNGAWTVTNTGTNGACANRWFISCAENGNAVGACGSGCAGSGNRTLHVANDIGCVSPNGCFFCPAGDCGAAYDASCPPSLCSFCCSCNSSQTDQRVESPMINLTGRSSITVSFKYMEGGQGASDNATLWYYNGATWSQLADMGKTPKGCGGQGIWTAYSVALPASADNNPNVRIGFRWVNNNDGSGADPSFAVDDIQLSVPYVPDCMGPLVNEVSNGPAGAKEYVELLVCGPPCSTVDLRGWKVDDNNGVLFNAFGNALAGTGTAAGHLRFSQAAQWAAVPSGALIVIYNNADPNVLLPPDDPSDTAPNDSVYVLAANNPLLQGCGTLPNPSSTSSYGTTCTFGAGNWNYISLRNEGDAMQVRRPDGTYFHGISYGSNANNMNNGGLDLLRISTLAHTGRVIFFDGADPRQPADFISATVAGNESPGAPNGAANAAFIAALRCSSTLPIRLVSFTAVPEGSAILTQWTTASEEDNAFFTVERSSDGRSFQSLGTIPGAGNSIAMLHYAWRDEHPLQGMVGYYRLRQTDTNGASTLSPVVAVVPATGISVVPQGGVLAISIPAGGEWELIDPLGRTVGRGTIAAGQGAELRPDAGAPIRFLRIRTGQACRTYRILSGHGGVHASPVR
ncbi:MAG TPA: hypothetical protein PKD45_07925 [Flavobacteriales bacterium]|nr:hypothetical protein [Flavobacteriales bacterium]